jgi:hypothetical protein
LCEENSERIWESNPGVDQASELKKIQRSVDHERASGLKRSRSNHYER